MNRFIDTVRRNKATMCVVVSVLLIPCLLLDIHLILKRPYKHFLTHAYVAGVYSSFSGRHKVASKDALSATLSSASLGTSSSIARPAYNARALLESSPISLSTPTSSSASLFLPLRGPLSNALGDKAKIEVHMPDRGMVVVSPGDNNKGLVPISMGGNTAWSPNQAIGQDFGQNPDQPIDQSSDNHSSSQSGPGLNRDSPLMISGLEPADREGTTPRIWLSLYNPNKVSQRSDLCFIRLYGPALSQGMPYEDIPVFAGIINPFSSAAVLLPSGFNKLELYEASSTSPGNGKVIGPQLVDEWHCDNCQNVFFKKRCETINARHVFNRIPL